MPVTTRHLPSIGQAMASQHSTISRNLAFPARDAAHVPWHGPCKPLQVSVIAFHYVTFFHAFMSVFLQKTQSLRFDVPFAYTKDASDPSAGQDDDFDVEIDTDTLSTGDSSHHRRKHGRRVLWKVLMLLKRVKAFGRTVIAKGNIYGFPLVSGRV
ncbi:hypothetical protein B0H34DRAFT_295838 [Crassisporium funariophilum]|nr:hypothetical protein B0H34DRAFT_295838 [Crassisporium funariophilum]